MKCDMGNVVLLKLLRTYLPIVTSDKSTFFSSFCGGKMREKGQENGTSIVF